MSEESNDSVSGGQEPAANQVGKKLKAARQAAKIETHKICSDLRISTQTLDALEEGNYHLLAGDPYIRALLGSLGRYLNLDPLSLVQDYNKETGAVHTASSVTPYKDRTQTHTATHKQIFIGIFAVLFIILFLLFRKLNVEEESALIAPPLGNGTVVDTLTPAQDTLVESNSLAPDSMLVKAALDSAKLQESGANPAKLPPPSSKGDSTHSTKPVPPPAASSPPVAPLAAPVPSGSATVTPGIPAAAPSAANPAAVESSQLIIAVVKPLVDNVGVKVMRYGKEDFSTVLKLGKQMQVSHNDTITVMISKRKSVEVTIGGKTVIPDKKRFKIYGTTLKAF